LKKNFIALKKNFIALKKNFIALKRNFIALKRKFIAIKKDIIARSDYIFNIFPELFLKWIELSGIRTDFETIIFINS
jgi:hypothetical protein